MPSGPVQLLKVSVWIVPSGLASPLPLFSEPVAADELQVSVIPVVESWRVVVPAEPLTAPPGVTVQRSAATGPAARAGPPDRQAAATAAPANKVPPQRVSFGISFSSVFLFALDRMPDARGDQGADDLAAALPRWPAASMLLCRNIGRYRRLATKCGPRLRLLLLTRCRGRAVLSSAAQSPLRQCALAGQRAGEGPGSLSAGQRRSPAGRLENAWTAPRPGPRPGPRYPWSGGCGNWPPRRPPAPVTRSSTTGPTRAGRSVSLTWAEVDQQARAEGAAVLAPQGLEYVVAMLGAFYARVVAVPLFTPGLPGHGDRLVRILADASPACVLTTEAAAPSVAALLREHALPRAEIISVDRLPAGRAADWRPEQIGTADVAYLQYTSGSTRAPAGVMITHGCLAANTAQIAAGLDVRPDRVTALSWLPLFHDMGFVLAVAMPIAAGATSVFTDPAHFLMRPVRWLRLASGRTEVFTAGPNFAYEYCAARISEPERAG